MATHIQYFVMIDIIVFLRITSVLCSNVLFISILILLRIRNMAIENAAKQVIIPLIGLSSGID